MNKKIIFVSVLMGVMGAAFADTDFSAQKNELIARASAVCAAMAPNQKYDDSKGACVDNTNLLTKAANAIGGDGSGSGLGALTKNANLTGLMNKAVPGLGPDTNADQSADKYICNTAASCNDPNCFDGRDISGGAYVGAYDCSNATNAAPTQSQTVTLSADGAEACKGITVAYANSWTIANPQQNLNCVDTNSTISQTANGFVKTMTCSWENTAGEVNTFQQQFDCSKSGSSSASSLPALTDAEKQNLKNPQFTTQCSSLNGHDDIERDSVRGGYNQICWFDGLKAVSQNTLKSGTNDSNDIAQIANCAKIQSSTWIGRMQGADKNVPIERGCYILIPAQ